MAAALVVAAASCGSWLSRPRYRPSIPDDASSRLARFFEEAFLTRLDRDPELRSRLGIGGAEERWTDRSEEHQRVDQELARRELRRLQREFDEDDLDEVARLSYRLFERWLEERIEAFEWRHHAWPVHPLDGLHTAIPAFLFEVHDVEDREDAEAYVTRLEGVRAMLRQVVDGLERREELGLLPPRFVFPQVLEECRALLRGEPFERSGADGPWLADLRRKLATAQELDEGSRATLLERGRAALLASVQPAYQALASTLERHARLAGDEAGVWRLPRGEAYYAFCLRRATTLEMDPEEIHRLGLREVARLHGELRARLERSGFERDLGAWFGALREERPAGAEAGGTPPAARVHELLDAARADLEHVVASTPGAALVLEDVAPWRAQALDPLSYAPAAAQGTRPALLRLNARALAEVPEWLLPALVHSEGLPGRHLQSSVTQELEHLPRFRQVFPAPAFVDGWALYAERLPAGLELDPEGGTELGRLASELWWASRLVVDTGMHQLHWSREEALDYLLEVTPAPRATCVRAVEHHAVLPGDGVAAALGLRALVDARERARATLGARYDPRAFHDLVLSQGPLPLGELEGLVTAWIDARRR